MYTITVRTARAVSRSFTCTTDDSERYSLGRLSAA